MRNRQKQRQLKKQQRAEKLETRNLYGNSDLTAYNAMAKVRGGSNVRTKAL